MAQPMLHQLRARLRAGSVIDALAPPWVAPVLRRVAEIDEVIEADLRHGALELGERWRLGRRLKARAYDEAIVLPNAWKSALAPFFAGIPVRSGYLGELRFAFLNSIHEKKSAQESMVVHYARLAQAPGTDPAGPFAPPALKKRQNETAAKFGLSGGYAVLCPGAEYGPAKRWPYFRELAARLNVALVLLGSSADASAAQSIPGTNLVGKTTLDEAIDLIAGSRYVVSNDSGLMHIAAALGTPQVALFGSSSPEHTQPGSGAARIVWLKPECSPCFARECPLGHFRCMRELGVERVLQEIEFLG